MTLQVSDIVVQPTLDLGGVVVHSGQARIGRAGRPMIKRGEPPAPFSFWVPDAAALTDAAPAPETIVVAAWLMQCEASNNGNLMGVEQLAARYEPDPRGGDSRWLLVSGTAHAGFSITIGYRVTLGGVVSS